ncbi:MAG: galactitol-1-phosphate 5-dehydrogenase [Clostridiales Family XIII bacterium]|jgi:L-iditol 2-dehydrogenase|nr:galactitol-1-phosphate 5-dehydrogenase [Clostridiales Family XIII bacterium]
MKAAVLYGNEDIRYGDWPTPEVRPGAVKIAVKASGICGSDVPRVLHGGAHRYPIVLGHEFAGVVCETGEGVTKIRPGDTVTVAPRIPCFACDDCLAGNIAQCKRDSFIGSREQGSFAEYIVAPEKNVVPYDPSVPFEIAVFFEPATVALHGVRNVGFDGGGNVAVIGAGTIGLFVVQWAKMLGARRVAAFDVDPARLSQARALGADRAVDSGGPDWEANAASLTDGKGFDWVFDAAGNNATLRASLRLAAAKAKISLIGTPQEGVSFSKDEWELINRKELWIRGCWQSYSLPFPGAEWDMTARAFGDGSLKADESFIFRKYPLADAAEAFGLFKNPAQVHGKVLLINEDK